MIFAVSYSLLWIVALTQLVMVLFLVQRFEELRHRVAHAGSAYDQLAVGSRAPSFAALSLESQESFVSDMLEGQPRVLLFLSADCADCRSLASEIGDLAVDELSGLVVYCIGAPPECDRFLAPLRPSIPTLVRKDVDVAELYRISSVPTAVGLDGDWHVQQVRSPSSARDLVANLKELRRSPVSTSTTESHMVFEPTSLSPR